MKTQGFVAGLRGGFLITWAISFLAAPLHAQLTNFQQLHSFGNADLAGSYPRRVIEASDGRLYGAARLETYAFEGIIYSLKRDGTDYRILHRFRETDPTGDNPAGGVMEASDGALYGVTTEGAANNFGAVFKINKDGTGLTALHAFRGSAQQEVLSPRGPLIEGSDGALYGVSQAGGISNIGTIFKLQKDGSGFQVLRPFGGTYDGMYPVGVLAEGSDGWLYGTTSAGGTTGMGTIFKIRKDGSDYQTLVYLLGGANHPAIPFAEMIEGSDGALYGTSVDGGAVNGGTVFKLQKDGTGFVVLHSLMYSNEPAHPYAAITEGPDGALYGTGTSGGPATQGGLFKLNKDGSGFRVLRLLPAALSDGHTPVAALALSRDGSFYGSTDYGGRENAGTLFRLNPTNDSYSTIYQFSRTGGEPAMPFWPLVPDRFGNLYGVAGRGGSAGRGVIYRMHQNGTGFEVVRSIGISLAEGSPVCGLILATDGNLYGTTSQNGAGGAGTVFKVAPDGSGFTLLHSFNVAPGDGTSPQCAVTEGSDGKLYGTTRQGGPGGAGTVFRINKDGTGYQILRGFREGGGDGYLFQDTVIEGSDGLLYGVTPVGGTNNVVGGTVFRMNRDGTGYRQIRNFGTIFYDGQNPSGPLLEGSDGFLYGLNSQGGSANAGTIYKVSKDGAAYSVIWRFANAAGSGTLAAGPLWEGNDGAIYGSAQAGGNYDAGMIFKINKDGTAFTILYHFNGISSGRPYYGGIVRGTDGAFYGTTGAGGEMGLGTIFRFGQMVALTPDPSRMQLSCTGVPGIIYEVQRSIDLRNWATLLRRRMPSNPGITYEDATFPANAAFYRVVPASLSP